MNRKSFRYAALCCGALVPMGLAMAADLSVGPGETHTVSSSESYGKVNLSGGTVRLNAGGSLGEQTVVGAASTSSTIEFNGGKLTSSSWDLTWFSPAAGADILLQSVDGNPLNLDVGYQRHNFSNGDGTVTTAGSGDIKVSSLDVSGERMYLTLNSGNVNWGHSGDLVASGSGGIKLQKGGTLPFGANVGGVKLTGSAQLYLDSEASSDVNSLEGRVTSIGWSYLRFGRHKDGVLKNTGRIGGVSYVQKYGSATRLTIQNADFRGLEVYEGAVAISDSPVVCNSLTVYDNAVLDVDSSSLTVTNACEMRKAATVAIKSGATLDVTTGRDDAFNLDSAGTLVKRGAGSWNVYGTTPLSGKIHVAEGSLKFRYLEEQSCTKDEWWRVSVTKQAYMTKAVTLVEIGLFDGADRVNGGLTATSVAVDAMPNGTAKITSSAFSSGNVANLFDSNASTLWGPNYVDTPKTPLIYGGNPLVVVMRLAAGKTVTSFDISNNSYYNDYANSLTVESSADGVNWVSRGSQTWTGKADWPNWYGGSSHYAVNDATRIADGTGKGSRGFAPGTVLRVDAGATLDTSLVKAEECVASALEIDATAGCGTITDLALAENGVLNIVNLPQGTSLRDLVLSFPVTHLSGSENLKTWAVSVNGTLKRGYEVQLSNGQLKFTAPGLVLIFR